MDYAVRLTGRAARELEEAAVWWAEHRSATQAKRWYDAFLDALLSLANNPQRCPHAREHNVFTYEVRQLTFGLGRRLTHRAVFTLGGDTVTVLTIRHLAQGDIDPSEFD